MALNPVTNISVCVISKVSVSKYRTTIFLWFLYSVRSFSHAGVTEKLEEKIEDVKLRRKAVEQDAITLENIYTLLANFEKVYDKISDEEKKKLISSLIKEIEIFPCDEAELPLKSILFNFPVYKDGGDVYVFLWDKSTHVSQFLECVKKIIARRGWALAETLFFCQSQPQINISHQELPSVHFFYH